MKWTFCTGEWEGKRGGEGRRGERERERGGRESEREKEHQ